MNYRIILIAVIGFFISTSPVRADFIQDMKNKVSQVMGKKDGSAVEPAAPLTEREKLLKQKEAEIERKRNSYQTGTLKTYYDANKKKVKQESNYRNGILHGVSKIYHENGKVKSEGKYVKGVKEGVFKIYDEKGKLKEEQLFQNGVLVDRRMYDEKGKLISVVSQ